jgi:hypothetical protein
MPSLRKERERLGHPSPVRRLPLLAKSARNGAPEIAVRNELPPTSGAKARIFVGLSGRAEQAAETCCLLEKRRTLAAKAGPIFRLTVWLKAYSDTNPEFFRSL